MPKKEFINHCWLHISPDGTHTVTFDRPASDGQLMMIDFIGSRTIEPPGSMTKQEYDKWSWKLCAGEGFTMHFGSRDLDAPRVEVREIPDDLPHNLDVRASLEMTSYNNEPLLVVQLTNCSEVDIPDIQVEFDYKNDAVQPVKGMPHDVSEIAGTVGFLPQQPFQGSLLAKGSHRFAFPPFAAAMLRSRVASSSSDSYGIIVKSGQRDLVSVNGSELGAFVEKNLPA